MHTEIRELQKQLSQVDEELEEILTSNLTFDARTTELFSLRTRLVSLIEKWCSTKAAMLGARRMRLHELMVEFDKRLSSTADQIGVSWNAGALAGGDAWPSAA